MEHSPYQTPGSDIDTGTEFKRSAWWKIYFFFITILSAIGIASFLTNPSGGLAEYANLFLWLVATAGLYGFVFLKPIYKPQFWNIFFVVYLLFSMGYYFITDIDLKTGMSDTVFYISTGIGWFLSLPGYYALYAYSRTKCPVWSRTK